MQRFPLPIPNGWFRVAFSHELAPGGVSPLHYFGQDLVLFRTTDGTPHVLDAHCAHLGAHLGHGGRVQGSALQCPFHGWLWDGTGRCLEVPYARKVPPKARMRAWLVREVNGIIWVHYHSQAESPHWEIPELPEYKSPEWLPFRPVHRWTIYCHPQDTMENGIDTGHVPFLHSQQTLAITDSTLEVDGPILVHRMSHTYNPLFTNRLLGSEVTGPLEFTYYGLGCWVSRVSVHRLLEFRFVTIFLYTPIDAESLEVHVVFSMQKIFNTAFTRVLAKRAIKELGRTLAQDIPIFNNKVYRSEPLLCDGDGPIMPYRRWARQFYTELPARTHAQVAP
jgi:phenylpropionate dioxygenase-like ring-hydroxylating dioxygenase large terminal subunit